MLLLQQYPELTTTVTVDKRPDYVHLTLNRVYEDKHEIQSKFELFLEYWEYENLRKWLLKN